MKVKLTKQAQKNLKTLKSNKSILSAYQTWESIVEELGLAGIRIIPGFNDEPIQDGIRISRLNKGYRVFYREIEEETKNGRKVTIIEVCEVLAINNHDYKKVLR